jgi:site-specific recombinase XerD
MSDVNVVPLRSNVTRLRATHIAETPHGSWARRHGDPSQVEEGHIKGHEELHKVLGDYTRAMIAAGNRPRTVKARLAGVSLLGQAVGADPRWVTTVDVQAWLALPHADWTRTTYYGHARAWFRFLVDSGRRDDDPTARMRRPKKPHGVPQPLDDVVVKELLASTRGRVYSYVLLGLYAGLRVHEIAQIRGVDVTRTRLRVVNGKGGKDATLPTHPAIWEDAQRYPVSAAWWFPSYSEAGHVAPGSVSTAVRRALRDIGVEGHAHQLRHTFGTNVLNSSGGNLRVAQELLRHESPTTTAVYTMVEDSAKVAAVLALGAA